MTEPSPPSILIYEHVTGGGMIGEPAPESWAAEGAAMRRALAAEFAAGRPSPRVIVALDPRLPEDPGPWETARVDSVERLEALAGEADCTLLIAPETNGVLEGLIRRLGRGPTRLLNASPEAVALAGDKAKLAATIRERGLRTPDFLVLEPGADPPPSWPPPYVLKPVDGAGSLDTHLVERAESPRPRPDPNRRRLLQSWVSGTPMSATFLVRPGSPPLPLAIGEQRIERGANGLGYLGGVLPTRIRVDIGPLAAALEAVPGLAGLVGVDFIRDSDSDQPVILEINPRATTSIVGVLALSRPGALAELWALRPAENRHDWLARGEAIRRGIGERGPVRFEPSGRVERVAESGDREEDR